VFKPFAQNLKHKTSQLLHRLAQQIEQEPETAAPASEIAPPPAEDLPAPGLAPEEDSHWAEHRHTLKHALELEPDSLEIPSAPLPAWQPHPHAQPGTLTLEEPAPQGEVPSPPLSPPEKPSSSRRPRRRRSHRKNKKENVASPKFSAPSWLRPLKTRLKPATARFGELRQKPRFWLWSGLGLGAGTGALAAGLGLWALESATQVNVEDIVVYAPAGTITLKASDGTILQEIGNVSHDQIQLGKIPPLVEKAFIASEDRRSYDHRGVDYQGILRAALVNAQAGGVVEGGSTITQQLARLVFLSQDRTVARKVKELRLAQKIETTLPKEQILERYLNLVYLGSGAYGVADASWAYFSKSPDQLTLGEAATLAGIVPAPSLYSPLEDKEAAQKRRDEVLQKMAAGGFITAEEAAKAQAQPLTLKPSPLKRFNRLAPFFTDYILKELERKVKKADLQAGGVVVTTTLNSRWQTEAEEIVQRSVKRYGGYQGFSEAALVSLDPRTGAIKTMVGGTDYGKSQFNRVTQAKRQPGSTFKPILYAAAIASGISPNKSYPDVPLAIGNYKPENYGDTYRGGPMSLREALTNSVNIVAVRLLLDVGWNPVIALSRKMGIESKIEPTYSIALGAWEMTPLEMTSAYGTFAKNGVHVQPFAVQKVVNAKGLPLYLPKHQQTTALDPDSNAIMTSLMRSVVTSGTGGPAQLPNRQVAGKTGTSDEARDLWFIGYIPQLVTGVWLGNDNNKPTRGASATAALIWGKFMREATEGMKAEYFPAEPKNPYARKPSIKAEPIKVRTTNLAIVGAPEGQSSTRRRSSRYETGTAETQPRRRRRRSRRTQETTQNTEETPRRSSRRRRRRVASRPAETSTSTQSAPSGGLPAPPAGRKEE